MYLQHFALREFPFGLTPDTEFFFRYGSHQEAHNVLLVALRGGEGFIKLTGEVGTGKTLLCRLLLKSLGDEFVSAYIPNPYLTPAALHRALADELGVEHARNGGQDRLLKLISDRLIELNKAGKRVVLLLDEAQTLPPASMEALRLLTNLETEKYKLLQVVLFGQPELDQRLAQRALRQLRQRISFAHRLRPIDRAGFDGYIAHRLRIAGYRGTSLFARSACDELHRASRGIPRLINVLCHKALLVAYGLGELQVRVAHVRRAARDTEDVLPQAAHHRLARAVLGTASIAATLMAGLGAMYFWGHAL